MQMEDVDDFIYAILGNYLYFTLDLNYNRIQKKIIDDWIRKKAIDVTGLLPILWSGLKNLKSKIFQ